MRGSGKYGRGAKRLSLAEALYGPAAATKESAPLLQIIGAQSEDLEQEESTTSRREAREEDLRLELREALEKLSRIQADYYCGLASVGDFNEAKCRVGDLRNQLGLEPQQKPSLSTAVSRPQWRQIPEED